MINSCRQTTFNGTMVTTSSVKLTLRLSFIPFLFISAFCSCLSYIAFASSFLLHPRSTQDLLASQNNSSDPELDTGSVNLRGKKFHSILPQPSNQHHYGHPHHDLYSSIHPFLDYLPLLSLSLLCFTFTCGLGPLPWVLSNEVGWKTRLLPCWAE